MSKLSIVVPVYYNEENLVPLYADLKEKVLDKLDWDYELIFVDDGSKDHSFDVMNQLKKIDHNIKLIRLSRNFGEHAATLAGISECTGDCVVRKAADLQEPSEMILDMLDKYKQGNKSVIAIRADRDEPLSQKIFAGLYTAIIRKFALSNMPKGGFDTFLIDRQIIDLLKSMNAKNAPVTEQILWCGFEPAQIPYVRRKREIGKSRWTFSKKIKMVFDSLLGFSYFPIRCISVIGGLSFFGSLIWMIVLLVQKAVGKITIEGYTTVTILTLMSFGIIMFSLGILGEYMWRMFDETRKRPPFIVDEIVGNSSEERTSQQ